MLWIWTRTKGQWSIVTKIWMTGYLQHLCMYLSMFSDMQLLINHAFLTGAVLILFTKSVVKAEGINWSSSKFIKPFKGLLIYGTRSNAVSDAKTSQKTCRERVRQPPMQLTDHSFVCALVNLWWTTLLLALGMCLRTAKDEKYNRSTRIRKQSWRRATKNFRLPRIPFLYTRPY
jgi:hypothetical protein